MLNIKQDLKFQRLISRLAKAIKSSAMESGGFSPAFLFACVLKESGSEAMTSMVLQQERARLLAPVKDI